MPWTVNISSKAEKYYNRLDRNMREKIKKELMHLSNYDDPVLHQVVKPLIGELRGFYRLRADYRIVFALLKNEQVIAVINIAPRGDIYKKQGGK